MKYLSFNSPRTASARFLTNDFRKMTAIFKEAIGDGHDEIEVARALTAVTDAITEWNCKPSICDSATP